MLKKCGFHPFHDSNGHAARKTARRGWASARQGDYLAERNRTCMTRSSKRTPKVGSCVPAGRGVCTTDPVGSSSGGGGQVRKGDVVAPRELCHRCSSTNSRHAFLFLSTSARAMNARAHSGAGQKYSRASTHGAAGKLGRSTQQQSKSRTADLNSAIICARHLFLDP